MSDFMKNLLVWMIMAAVTLTLFNQFQGEDSSRVGNPHRIDYTQFIQEVKADRVSRVDLDGRTIHGFYTSGEHFMTFNPGDPGLVGDLLNHNVVITAPPPEKQGLLMQMFISWFPMLLLIAVWIFFMRSAGGLGGKNSPFSFGKSKARMQSEDQVKVTFEDVAGADEAKEEVHEVVDFLRDPEKYRKLGGSIPRGILMVGPPGTGKTLLAKAIAGEAKVPFFTISGSDFVEMFVGVGASRVRDMFEQAKAHAPCIIFIDEIDAVGRSRGAGMGGGNDEREQTLNQMLVEMDGFEGNEGIIVIAATNRPDVLDPALLRPGRFDRQVTVGLPDVRGREQILKVHMRKVPLAEGVKPGAIARGTPGFSGADLANLVNEAALFAARVGKEKVTHEDFEKAKDKIIMGVERKSMVMKDEEKKLTAYHEAGHAIIGWIVPEHDPVYKVSIIPRGRALGVTMYLPEEDRYSYSKRRLESQLSSLYGGRIAEEMIFGADAVTTGASNDIERATSLARNMVMKWGMSDKLGPQLYEEEDNSNPFLGGGMARTKALSPETGKLIDDEIHALIDRNYKRAEQILRDNFDKLHIMGEALMKYETIDDEQVRQIMEEGRFPDAPKDWNEDVDQPMDAQPPTAGEVVMDDAVVQPMDASATNDALPESGSVPKWN
ncbi:MAG: ATP-dependent metalloprotease [Thiotrichales bacterium 32-46-8]|nr:ATP-dependent zinc metalloprotease FtsH [Gammaproteobacteria bacterium]OYX07649.1 MAG: ATP-dependent metalloprotease [Thiotrichales bacterium 32-46-8]OYZ09896.1 MAG: ATP-dependent metalloprotease [Thiotrichales bacterium 16-46-22]OZA20614.1 MAG: ATP-dependent metalloprotease [Thiotrichales bacterium 17-46-47]OZA98425.1 MAG: ATP-dependent metalloprotease [Thiotrichales bacterium 34-46-19]OZB86905.1 MAG: ATP-dependent metalloprotease [Thiotrichales bacterium 12-47-6]HQT01577.1 ATP-dependent 